MIEVLCCSYTVIIRHPFEILPYDSVSFCIAVDIPNNEYTFVRNGVDTMQIWNNSNEVRTDSFVSTEGELFIGQEQDTLRGGFNPMQTLRGQLADLVLYSDTLHPADMTKWVNGEEIKTNHVVFDFSNFSVFEQSNVETFFVQRSTFKKSERTFLYLFPELYTFLQAKSHCQYMAGEIFLPRTEAENDLLFALTSVRMDACMPNMNLSFRSDIVWLGASGNYLTNTWSHYKYDEHIENGNNFMKNEFSPILKNRECITFMGCGNRRAHFKSKWVPTRCSFRRNVVCHFQSRPFLALRGLPLEISFDKVYYINDWDGNVKFHGLFTSVIERSSNDMKWTLYRYDEGISATLDINDVNHYPTGRQKWKIISDFNKNNTRYLDLLLTACNESSYSCRNGDCIPQPCRCNNIVECSDSSDEEDCSIVFDDPKYNWQLTPPLQTGQNATIVNVSVEIESVNKVSLNDFLLSIDFKVTSEWIDSRLMFKNLFEITEKNILYNITIWVPKFSMYGDQYSKSDVSVKSEHILVTKLTEPLPDNDEHLDKG